MSSEEWMRSTICALLVTLAACDRPASPASPTSSPTSSPSPQATLSSIIRPDVEIEPDSAPALTPLKLRLQFEEGSADLSAAAIASLKRALASDQLKEGGTITLAGHSDSSGDDVTNLAASRHRAEAVQQWLVANGVANDRIIVIAFGEQNPVAPNALESGEPNLAGRAMNRRVDVTIAAPEDVPPPKLDEDETLVGELTS